MLRPKVFSAGRDGQIRVKLNDGAREFLEVVVDSIIAAETIMNTSGTPPCIVPSPPNSMPMTPFASLSVSRFWRAMRL